MASSAGPSDFSTPNEGTTTKPATLSSARGLEGSDSAVCKAGDEGRPGSCDVPVSTARYYKGMRAGTVRCFSQYEETCNFPPLDRTGPRDKGSRSRNVRSRCRCSLSPAIRISSRGWPRSSSTDEPSDPPSRVFKRFFFFGLVFEVLFGFGVCEKLKKGRRIEGICEAGVRARVERTSTAVR